jgi:hypothetical protein
MAQGRRAGYVVAALLNAGVLYAVNRWPGWETVGFLTDRTPEVLGLVNASLLVSLVANLTYLVHDGPRWRATGDLVVTAVGATALLRIWRVFPFDFGASGLDWSLVVHVLLAVGIVGSGIAIVVAFARLVRGRPVSGPGRRRHPRPGPAPASSRAPRSR